MSFLPLIIIFVIFYFLLIRPQRKQQKSHDEMVKSLSKGDEVVGGTINGTGSFVFEATRVGADTVLAQIIRLVEEAQASKPPAE